jgi:hypothetical protein
VAAGLAADAGRLLLDVRDNLVDATHAERKVAGDKRSHEFWWRRWQLSARPTRCSLRKVPTIRCDYAPSGYGSSTRWTAPGSSPNSVVRIGPYTWRCGNPVNLSPARSPCRRMASRWPHPMCRRRRHMRDCLGLWSRAPGRRRLRCGSATIWTAFWLRWDRPGPRSPRSFRVWPRCTCTPVDSTNGIPRRAGRRGSRRRIAHLTCRWFAAGVQPGRSAATRSGRVPLRIRRSSAGCNGLSGLVP